MPQSYVRVRFLHHHHRQACRPSSENRSVFCPCRRGLITVTSPGISTERDSHAHLTSCMLSEYVRDTWLALCRPACPDGRGCRAHGGVTRRTPRHPGSPSSVRNMEKPGPVHTRIDAAIGRVPLLSPPPAGPWCAERIAPRIEPGSRKKTNGGKR
jgi:hypothetical protein